MGLIGVAVAVLAIAGLAVAEVLDVAVLTDPRSHLDTAGLGAALLGVGLLVADIVLPVPSSLVMLAHGALFGVVPGALLSLLGRTGNAAVGVAVGRGAGALFATRRGQAEADRRADRMVERWGLSAVVVTRPVPVLAEATVVAAGAARLSPLAVVGAAAVGAVPEAVLYAMAGRAAASSATGAAVFLAGIALAAAVAAVARRRSRRQAGVYSNVGDA